jgi:hypothetical protein
MLLFLLLSYEVESSWKMFMVLDGFVFIATSIMIIKEPVMSTG